MTTYRVPSYRQQYVMKAFATAFCLSTLAAFSARATDYTRDPGADAVGDWTDSSKWDPSGHPQTTADSAIFNTDATERTVTLDASQTIGLLGVGYNPGSGTLTGNIRLESASASLTVGSSGVPGAIFVGAGTAATTGGAAGTLELGSGTTLNLVGLQSSFYIGGYSTNTTVSAAATTGIVTMEAGSSLNLGSGESRAQWYIGRQTTTGENTATGAFSATGGDLTAYLTTLVVGQNVRGSNRAATHKGSGTLDLSGLATARIDAVNLIVGKSQTSSATGSVTLGSGHLLTIGSASAGSVEMGVRTGDSGSKNGTTGTASGLLTLEAGSEAAFGTESLRTGMTLGSNNDVRAATIIAEGTITAEAGSSFSGYFSSLVLGSQMRTDNTVVYRATGIMDLRLAEVSAFDVSGEVRIGYHSGTGEGSQGELRLAQTSGVIGGNLFVGDGETGGGSQVSSSGLLELAGAHLEVAGDVTLGITGRVNVSLDGESAGLRLAEDSAFSLATAGSGAGDPNAAYFIDFGDPAEGFEGVYYGFAWEGDHEGAVQSLVDQFYITWSNNLSGGASPGVFYDAGLDLTYIGIAPIPEPSSTALLVIAACGGLGSVLRRKQRQR